MLNKAILMGRLTRDPELRYTPANVAVASFTLAVDRNFKNDGEIQTDFIDIVCWRQRAEFVSKYFHKGQLVVASGSIQTRTWKDKEGNNRKSFEIVAEDVYFAESRNGSVAPSDDGFRFNGNADISSEDVPEELPW